MPPVVKTLACGDTGCMHAFDYFIAGIITSIANGWAGVGAMADVSTIVECVMQRVRAV